MTEEQIKQQAEKYAGVAPTVVKSIRYEAYLAGAHSRDEEIEKWKNLCDRLSIEKRQLQKKLHNLDN